MADKKSSALRGLESLAQRALDDPEVRANHWNWWLVLNRAMGNPDPPGEELDSSVSELVLDEEEDEARPLSVRRALRLRRPSDADA